MNTATLELPEVATRAEWLAARLKLLAKEKELTHARDALNAERRRLPMVKMEKDYVFEGPEGKVRLLDLFEDRLQLVIYHFMWLWDDGKPRDEGCPSCSAWADEIARGQLIQLHLRATTLALVSRAPFAKLDAFKKRMGWTLPWYSSFGSDFNYDFGVTIDESVAPLDVQLSDQGRARACRNSLLFRGETTIRFTRDELLHPRWGRGFPHLLQLRSRR